MSTVKNVFSSHEVTVGLSASRVIVLIVFLGKVLDSRL